MCQKLINLSAFIFIFIFSFILGISEVSAVIVEDDVVTVDYKNYDVRVISDVTAEQLDNKFQGALKGKGSVFIDAGKANGVDPAFLAALSIHETGNGSSELAKPPFNNVGGITCVADHNCGSIKAGGTSWTKFSSVEDSIKFKAEMLVRLYFEFDLFTISQIQSKYAPNGVANDPNNLNQYWVSGVGKNIASFGVTTSSNNGGEASSAEGNYADGEEVGSLLKKYGFDKGEISISNVGVDNRKSVDSKINEYGVYSFGSKIGLVLYKIAQVASIFLLGFISILWLIAFMAFSGMYFANEWLSKLTLNKIDVLEKGGFGKLGILTGFVFLVIVIVITGLVPKLFALIYSMLADFTEFISRISFM